VEKERQEKETDSIETRMPLHKITHYYQQLLQQQATFPPVIAVF
jgi:hypothetical protein